MDCVTILPTHFVPYGETRAITAQTMAYSDSLKHLGHLQTVKLVAFCQSVRKLVYQLVSQSVSHEKVMRKSWEIMKKSWESHEEVMRKSWEYHMKIMRKSWKAHEKLMRQSWESHDNVRKKIWKISEKVMRKAFSISRN